MPLEKSDASYVWDMLDAAKAVTDFVSSRTFHDYQNDRMLRGAVERHLEIIGEAASKVSKEFQKTHSDIPWRKIISQRHVLAHEYGELEDELVWKVATISVADLVAKLEKVLPSPPEIQE